VQEAGGERIALPDTVAIKKNADEREQKRAKVITANYGAVELVREFGMGMFRIGKKINCTFFSLIWIQGIIP